MGNTLAEADRKHYSGWCPNPDALAQRRAMLPSGMPFSVRSTSDPAGGERGPDSGNGKTIVTLLPDVCLLALIVALQIIALYPVEILSQDNVLSLIVPVGFTGFWIAIWFLSFSQANLNFGTRKLLIGCILSIALALEIIAHII